MHRLGPGLPGYLIPFAPLALVHQRQLSPSSLPSPLVFFLISTDFTPTPGIPAASEQLQICSIKGIPQVKPEYFTSNLLIRLRTLYAQ